MNGPRASSATTHVTIPLSLTKQPLTVMKMEWFQPNEGGAFLEDFDYILKVVKIQYSKNNWVITYNDLKG